MKSINESEDEFLSQEDIDMIMDISQEIDDEYPIKIHYKKPRTRIDQDYERHMGFENHIGLNFLACVISPKMISMRIGLNMEADWRRSVYDERVEKEFNPIKYWVVRNVLRRIKNIGFNVSYTTVSSFEQGAGTNRVELSALIYVGENNIKNSPPYVTL